MAREKVTTYRVVDDVTGDKLNPNQVAAISVTIGTKVHRLDTAKSSELVKSLVAAAGKTENKRGRKPGGTNTPDASGTPETPTETPEAEAETPENDS